MARRPLSPEKAFPVTAGAPHLRGFWTLDRISAAVIIALIPPLAVAMAGRGLAFLALTGVALAAAIGWQAVFAASRRRRLTPSGVATALIVALFLPADAPLWQVGLAVSFGVVIGEHIFGGYGRNFVNPAALTLAFLMFSFPGGGFDKAMVEGWAAPLAGGVFLVAVGIVSWRVLIGGILGAIGAAVASGGGAPVGLILAGNFLFGLIFLAGDPVAAPSTNGGRWLYGIIIGALAIIGAADGAVSARAIVFACLVGSIFAPLIDQGAIWIHVKMREMRNGAA
ncbi:MAG TPA: RnfABCDGE type electron transport complex subunit D [Alphaproteobacteria bacterium]|nr:RnfABCDGE type electron transport complex subunit D [Alphaproteobacteria bacterium]